MHNKIIAFSGIDGCGKSTQIKLLVKHCEENRIPYKVIWARPGSTPFLLALKVLARRIFINLPNVGRSKKRDEILKKTKLGTIWSIISVLELLYIYKIQSLYLSIRGISVIFDRHIMDAIIDYRIILGRSIKFERLIARFCCYTNNITKIYISIPIQESTRRCLIKWEPFPDTKEEREMRYLAYAELLSNFNYFIICGLNEEEFIHNKIIKLIYDNE